jgi:quercetin dioxygenase-like cupin family protein
VKIINLNDAAAWVHADGVPVHGAPATGLSLHTNGHLGADILHVPAGEQFPVHTHPGDHLLLCLHGTGTISVGAETFSVRPGDFYMVDGLVPHAVGAGDEDHILVAIGSPHKPVSSPERMAFTDWAGNPLTSPIFAREPASVIPDGFSDVYGQREYTAEEIRDLQKRLDEVAARRMHRIYPFSPDGSTG